MSIETRIGQLLREHKLSLGAAESCTGGLIGHRITDVPGASAYFVGSIVAYADDAKEHVLGVGRDTLNDHGAVSEQTAREMARGARRALRADVAVAVTGIAGPGGGQPGKPVGLTWIALSARDDERAEQFVWAGDRARNKAQSAEAVLNMLLEYLVGLPLPAR